MTLSFNNWLTLLMAVAATLLLILVLYLIPYIRFRKKILMRKGQQYLIRYTLIDCPLFNLKIHKTLMSDPADFHDHPWNYVSIILWGGYTEEKLVDIQVVHYPHTHVINHTKSKWYWPGCILFRHGSRMHRLIIPENKYCITMIFTSKRWRNWGFMKEGKWTPNESTASNYQ